MVAGHVTAPRAPPWAMLSGADHPAGRDAGCVVDVEDCVEEVGDGREVVVAAFAVPHADASRVTATRTVPIARGAGAPRDQLIGTFRPYFIMHGYECASLARSSRGSSGRRTALPDRDRLRQAIPESTSRTTLLARKAVTSAWSYGGDTSTTSTTDHRKLARDPADGVQELPTREPTWLGRACSGGHTRVDDVDVHRQEDTVAPVHRDRERLGEACRRDPVVPPRSSRSCACCWSAIQSSVSGSGQ